MNADSTGKNAEVESKCTLLSNSINLQIIPNSIYFIGSLNDYRDWENLVCFGNKIVTCTKMYFLSFFNQTKILAHN